MNPSDFLGEMPVNISFETSFACSVLKLGTMDKIQVEIFIFKSDRPV
jgi:hypothetical protein